MSSFNNSTSFINNTSSNFTQSGLNLEIYNRMNTIAMSLFIILSIGIILCNLMILVTIPTSPTLRTELRYVVITSLAFCDLLVGLVCIPLYADFTVQRKITVSCFVHVALQVLLAFSHVMVTNIGILIINIDYIIKQYDYKMPHFNPVYKRPFNILMSLLPWIVMFIVVPPIIKTGLHDYVGRLWTDTMCPVMIYKWAKITLGVLCSYLPLFGMMITSSIIIYGCVAKARGNIAFRPTLLNEEKPMLHPKFLITVNIACLLLMLPEDLIRTHVEIREFIAHITAALTGLMLAISKGIVLPIIWLLTPEVNEAFKERCSLSYWRRSPDLPQSLVNKTYKEFAKEEGNVD